MPRRLRLRVGGSRCSRRGASVPSMEEWTRAPGRAPSFRCLLTHIHGFPQCQPRPHLPSLISAFARGQTRVWCQGATAPQHGDTVARLHVYVAQGLRLVEDTTSLVRHRRPSLPAALLLLSLHVVIRFRARSAVAFPVNGAGCLHSRIACSCHSRTGEARSPALPSTLTFIFAT